MIFSAWEKFMRCSYVIKFIDGCQMELFVHSLAVVRKKHSLTIDYERAFAAITVRKRLIIRNQKAML